MAKISEVKGYASFIAALQAQGEVSHLRTDDEGKEWLIVGAEDEDGDFVAQITTDDMGIVFHNLWTTVSITVRYDVMDLKKVYDKMMQTWDDLVDLLA